jgi:hypothetical protein
LPRRGCVQRGGWCGGSGLSQGRASNGGCCKCSGCKDCAACHCHGHDLPA